MLIAPTQTIQARDNLASLRPVLCPEARSISGENRMSRVRPANSRSASASSAGVSTTPVASSLAICAAVAGRYQELASPYPAVGRILQGKV